MASSLEASLNRSIKKHFPEEKDNSDEDFEEELARSFKKKEKNKKKQPSDFVPVGTELAAQELLIQRPRGFPMPQSRTAPSMSAMFGNRMAMNHMTNGGMMASRPPSGLPFPAGLYFAPDGRPMYPPQFYQNPYSQQQAYAHYQQQLQSQQLQGQQLRYPQPRNNPMPHGPMHAGFPQGLSERMQFGAGALEEVGRRQSENDHRSLLHQHRPISTTGKLKRKQYSCCTLQ